MTLTEFLLARIAEDEARVRSLSWPERVLVTPWRDGVQASVALDVEGEAPKRYARIFRSRQDVDWGWVVHESAIEVVGPVSRARVLAECEAKRRVVMSADRLTDDSELQDIGWEILGNLASMYADHPDYQQGWKL